MSFVSYAQNYEDVMLWRALKSEGPGHYIDLGAGDPDELSVTKAFYQRGWTGINVEPATVPFQRLLSNRPNDVNLQVAAADHIGRLPLYLVGHTDLSTLVPHFAERLRETGRTPEEVTVEVVTLADICIRHWAEPTHFLKIDVEGSEKQALDGADFTRWRPWIVVVESTEPESQTPSYATWEPILLASQYHLVYFDGLNRFYVAAEHQARLSPAFGWPPCVFDDFLLEREQVLRQQVETLRGSPSMRLTAPLRTLKRLTAGRRRLPR